MFSYEDVLVLGEYTKGCLGLDKSWFNYGLPTFTSTSTIMSDDDDDDNTNNGHHHNHHWEVENGRYEALGGYDP